MGSVIIALLKREQADKIAGFIRGQGMSLDVNICETGAEVLRIANDRDFGVVICTKKLRDMGYADMAMMLPENFGTIVLTKDSSLEIINESMVKLILPFRMGDLVDTIDMLTEGFLKRIKKKHETVKKRKPEDEKLIARAKAMLMERNGLSEEEAFRYIQKNSMDFGRKMVESAQMILTLYSD